MNKLLALISLNNWQGSLLLGFGILVGLWLLYYFSTKGLHRYLDRKAYKQENVQNFFLVWRYSWAFLAAVLIIVGLSGSLATLGISAAFLGMILGWSLQAPVTGIAAWVMIILKRPFRLGDRIIINNIIGDVVDITLTHIVLNQVGGTTAGEERSGRVVMIPNGILFQQVIYNYTFNSSYILDEVMVSVTFGSDIQLAEQIILQAAHLVTASIMERIKKEPFVRFEMFDSGIRLRLRYQTIAKERQRISSDITRKIIEDFSKTKEVNFAYPHIELVQGKSN